MINILALSLVLTTLLTATVYSPTPPLKNQDVIVKEGHRVVMVEFDEEGDGNTKVSISSSDHAHGHFGASVKDKISGVVGVAKEKLKEDAELAKDSAIETKSRFWGAAETAKDSVTDKAKQAADLAGDAARVAKSRLEGGAKEAVEVGKEGIKETAEMAKQRAIRGKEAVEEAIETTKTMKGDIERKASEKMEKIEGEGKIWFQKIWRRCRRLLHSTFDNLKLFMSVLQLFGFATAYGMSMWVTFSSTYVLAKVLPRQQFTIAQSKIYPLYFKTMAYSIVLALLGHLLSKGREKFADLRNFQGFSLLLSLAMILANLLYFEPRSTKLMFERLKWEKEEGRGVHNTPVVTNTVIKTRSNEATANSAEATEDSGDRLEDSVVLPSPETEANVVAPPVAESEREATRLEIIKLSEALKKLQSYSSYLNTLTLMGLTFHLVHLGHRLGTVR